MTTEFIEFLKARRSVRHFLPDPIPDDAVAKIITAATWAPTAGNVQPWHFYVVRSDQLKEKLVATALDQRFIAQAPVVIVVCADINRAKATYGVRGERLYSVQDTAAATQNMLLMAHCLGLGTCWVGSFSEDLVSQALHLPPFHHPMALIPVGKPGGERPQSPGRRTLEEVFTDLG